MTWSDFASGQIFPANLRNYGTRLPFDLKRTNTVTRVGDGRISRAQQRLHLKGAGPRFGGSPLFMSTPMDAE